MNKMIRTTLIEDISINTKRLIIRPMQLSDFNLVQEAMCSVEKQMNRWDSCPRNKLSLVNFKKLLKRQKSGEKIYFQFFLKKSGQFVGSASLTDFLYGHSQSASIGYGLINFFWGQGLAKEGVAAVVKYALKTMGLHRIEALIEPDNKRSVYLIRSLGFRKEGYMRKRMFVRDKWTDLLMYAATCEDFGIKPRKP